VNDFVRLSLRPGETIYIKDFDRHDQYAIKLAHASLPPGKKLDTEFVSAIAQIIDIDGIEGWVWVATDPVTDKAIVMYMRRANCRPDIWYSMSIVWGRQCTQFSV